MRGVGLLPGPFCLRRKFGNPDWVRITSTIWRPIAQVDVRADLSEAVGGWPSLEPPLYPTYLGKKRTCWSAGCLALVGLLQPLAADWSDYKPASLSQAWARAVVIIASGSSLPSESLEGAPQ